MSSFRYLTIVVLLSLEALSGCKPAYCTWSQGYEKHVVGFGELPGRYKLTDYSKKIMLAEGGYQRVPASTLQINADSTYILTNAPDWLNNALGTSFHHYFSQKGKFLVFSCNDDNCFIEFSALISADIVRNKNNHQVTMLFTVGDPDSCQGMAYEKQ